MSATKTHADESIVKISDIEKERQLSIRTAGKEARIKSLAQALIEIESITDESDDTIDWKEAERDLDSFRPERKLFTV